MSPVVKTQINRANRAFEVAGSCLKCQATDSSGGKSEASGISFVVKGTSQFGAIPRDLI
jgi:hypothetical protein